MLHNLGAGPPGPRGSPWTRSFVRRIKAFDAGDRPTGASAAVQGDRPTNNAGFGRGKTMRHWALSLRRPLRPPGPHRDERSGRSGSRQPYRKAGKLGQMGRPPGRPACYHRDRDPAVKTIFHVDMGAFFVSVEELFDPSLKGKAVVVGGRPDERGVVSAASYEARKFGVHSAMPLRTAARLCPHAIFVDGHPTRYREYSARVHETLNRFSPLVEMASIDEAYLDMTGTARLHAPPLAAAHALHETMKAETRLNCSIGISTARLVAKVASDQAKPSGVLWIMPGSEAAFLAPLDVRKIPGVGKVTEKNLHMLSIRKVGDLARLDDRYLEERFGKWGLALAGKARGLDAGGWFDTEIGANSDPKSISHEHTYNEDTSDLAVLESTLARLSEMVGRRLRENALHPRTL